MLKSPSGGLQVSQITVFGNPPKRRLIQWHSKTKLLPVKTVVLTFYSQPANKNFMQKKDSKTSHKDVHLAVKQENNVLVILTAVKDKCTQQYVLAVV
jgi:hypothetical protein